MKMTEENWVEPYLHQDKKIEKIQDSMTVFLKEQLAAGGKIDRLMDSQTHMQNRLDKSSETGFKSFEMLKGIVSEIGSIKTSQDHQEKRLTKSEDFQGKYMAGLLVVAVTALVSGIVSVSLLLLKVKSG